MASFNDYARGLQGLQQYDQFNDRYAYEKKMAMVNQIMVKETPVEKPPSPTTNPVLLLLEDV
jgi:hypothetical protein